MATIEPVQNLVDRNFLDEDHGLASITKPIYEGIGNKEKVIAALVDELDANTEDVKELLQFMKDLQKSDGTLEIEEGSQAYKKFQDVLNRLKAHGHDVNIEDFCSVENRNGKKVYVFSEKQKTDLEAKLDNILSATEHTRQEKIAELQKATQEERELWNLLSNIIKIYYDMIKEIATDTGV